MTTPLAHIAPPWIPVPPLTYGGTELMVDLLVRGLRKRGLEVVVFCSGDSTLPAPKEGIYPLSFWPPDKFSENLHLAHAWQWLQHHPVALIHSHLENAAGFWQVWEKAPPLVVTLHTPVTPMKRDYLLHFPAVHLVAVSESQRRRLEGHPRLHLIPHGLDLAAYPEPQPKEEYLLFLGRIYPEKGLHTAIRVAQTVNLRLLCAGPVFPPDQPYFESQIAPHLDGDRVIYVGPADFANKLRLLGRAQALLLPLEVEEAFGLVMLEAMACGTPVVAYGRGAAPEVVRHGETGFIAADFAELLEGIRLTAGLNPHVCRQHVADCFSSNAMVEAYMLLYRSVL
ncbi:glycosyltransferase family 4 protein [Desulfobacca acetoxidans]|uniref:Glycosyl transferase group 1 n=1 Tax=Desulfobacca acetoxidans (strain ATCC 700848 / DSM 11109 / ASRB2) TaxID=880072 RepID=F2NJ65_DESAR|nr:glycosyltransferase family 4 protein [Desulfobacca acetoxidans]AEB08023.1 glycosyl transferase group 1 [Desulfobacca acetoxidans DSM 11109]